MWDVKYAQLIHHSYRVDICPRKLWKPPSWQHASFWISTDIWFLLIGSLWFLLSLNKPHSTTSNNNQQQQNQQPTTTQPRNHHPTTQPRNHSPTLHPPTPVNSPACLLWFHLHRQRGAQQTQLFTTQFVLSGFDRKGHFFLPRNCSPSNFPVFSMYFPCVSRYKL